MNELEDYAFIVDKETFEKNKIKLLYFVANFHKFVENNEILVNKIAIPMREMGETKLKNKEPTRSPI